MLTTNVMNIIAGAASDQPAIHAVTCQYCGNPITGEELAMLMAGCEDGVLHDEDKMCETCASTPDAAPENPAPVAAPPAANPLAGPAKLVLIDGHLISQEDLDARLASLQVLNKDLKAKADAAKTAAAKTGKTGASKPGTDKAKVKDPEPDADQILAKTKALQAEGYVKADALVLACVVLYKPTAPRADGKPNGAIGAKVHSAIKRFGFSDELTRSLVNAAKLNKTITWMSVPTSGGKTIALYFDGRERTENSSGSLVVTADQKAAMLALLS